MTIKAMHYEFKQRMNKLDSNKNRNFLVPEIDIKLNEAQELFVKMVAEPRLANGTGFEKNQRTIDDIRTIVKRQRKSKGQCITLNSYDTNQYVATLPVDYWFHIRSIVYADKGNCVNQRMRCFIRQQDDMFEESPFDKSSFEWREINGIFNQDGIIVDTDGTFTPKSLCLSYIRYPIRMHNAEDFSPDGYTDLDGIPLTGTQDCELPKGTHSEIVDIAVAIASGDINAQDFQLKQYKLNFNK